jgi:polyisoprenoid-binding protein YceI
MRLNSTLLLAPCALLALLTATPVLAEPTTYVVDGAHTYPRFSYSHFGFSTQLSRFDKTSGTVVFDKEARTGAVDIAIDMTSVSTGSDALDKHIQSEDFFDTAKYPAATFKSSKIIFADGNEARPVAIEGKLTLKGVTRPVTLEITSFTNRSHPMTQHDAIGANATATIKRSDFNAGKYAPNVGDEVRIDIAIEASTQ